jgi:hypothetical protein
MNCEPRTDLIPLITRMESLSGDADPADVDSSPQRDFWRVIVADAGIVRARPRPVMQAGLIP